MRALKPVTLMALLALGLYVQPGARAQSIVNVHRTGSFLQTGTSTVTSTGWNLGTSIFENSQNSVTSATLAYPGAAAPVPLTDDPYNPGYDLNYRSDQFATQAALDTAYPMGTYTIAYTGPTGSGSQSAVFAQDHFSDSIPLLSQTTYSSLQGMNTGQAFTASWNTFTAFTAPSSHSNVYFFIFNADLSNGPDFFDYFPDASSGDSLTFATVPAGTLLPGMTYYAEVQFSNDSLTSGDGNPNHRGFNHQYSLFTLAEFTTAPAPEPSQFAALGIGILGLAGLGLRARSRQADAA